MRISDWSSDVGSSDLDAELGVELAELFVGRQRLHRQAAVDVDRLEHGVMRLLERAHRLRGVERLGIRLPEATKRCRQRHELDIGRQLGRPRADQRSEEHTSELQSLMRISYAVFCLN